MARHSHWAQIKRTKGVLDVKRGKVFTRHAKLIALTAQKGGGDPEMNPMLRMAIDNARADNMPKENIERAIKKGTGEGKEGALFSEVLYEGFGPGGVAVMVEAVTDNKNRLLQEIRQIFVDHGGSLGSSGSVSYLFEQKGVIQVKGKRSREEDELLFIDAGAEDIRDDSVLVAPQKLAQVRAAIEKAGFFILSAELSYEPKTYMKIEDQAVAQKIIALMGALEENEDVSKVSANFEISGI